MPRLPLSMPNVQPSFFICSPYLAMQRAKLSKKLIPVHLQSTVLHFNFWKAYRAWNRHIYFLCTYTVSRHIIKVVLKTWSFDFWPRARLKVLNVYMLSMFCHFTLYMLYSHVFSIFSNVFIVFFIYLNGFFMLLKCFSS